MTGNEIRSRFLTYFAEKGHTIVESSSLVPVGDPTLLFTNAGMVQFKDVFLGRESRPYRRAATAQKCLRAGGKHNDLEMVGRTARHHTFFEMLGNFSFGDYFKAEAIAFAWDFLTARLGLRPETLWISVYRDDDEAFRLWREVAGVGEERILRLGEKDNFWSMGDTGPCGPCSEILVDRQTAPCGPECAPGNCDCDRWLEIWNLVFMQYDRGADGVLTPLPRPSIDTGMGLERIASVLQGVASNYDTDLLRPVIARVEEVTARPYSPGKEGFAFRVIADHARALAFLVADGVLPANEGRGHVLRRILRRAARFGQVLGVSEPFLDRVLPAVVDTLGDAYPALRAQMGRISAVVRTEEERFHHTLAEGSRILDGFLERAAREDRPALTGEEAFTLFDTYGFPLDLTADAAAERGLGVDRAGFEACMDQQRRRARLAGLGGDAGEAGLADELAGLPPTRFVGYGRLEEHARILALWTATGSVQRCERQDEVRVLLDRTPLYATGGGQRCDQGRLEGPTGALVVEDVRRVGPYVLHRGRMEAGSLSVGEEILARVDEPLRRSVERNHTATHLLHAALRGVLGEGVHQAGSSVEEGGLRFDYTAEHAPTPAQLAAVEDLVNERIMADQAVAWTVLAKEEALRRGAVALFGEKYGDEVRMVEVSDGFSRELCGGTHVERTGEIGSFRIRSEAGIGTGQRRIEAVTGAGALGHARRVEEALADAGRQLKVAPEQVPQKVEELAARLRELERQREQLSRRLLAEQVAALEAAALEEAGATVVLGTVAQAGANLLRQAAEQARDHLASGVVLLASPGDGRIDFVAAVTPDLVRGGVHAGHIVQEVARVVGGGGGGRGDLAQAGGRDPGKLPQAMEQALQVIRRQLATAGGERHAVGR